MKIVLLLGGIAVVIVGAGYFMLFGDMSEYEASQSAETTTMDTVATDETTFEASAGTGTLEELRLLGADIECTISYDPEGVESTVTGTYFVSDNQVRGDFLTATPDLVGEMLTSMIFTNETVYIWTDLGGVQQGIKVDTAQFETNEQAADGPVAMDADVTYDCKPWLAVDRTVFEPPSEVLFQDFNAVMGAGMEYGTVYEAGVEMQ